MAPGIQQLLAKRTATPKPSEGAAPAAAPNAKPELSEEQRQRIEENRRKALEKRRKRSAPEAASSQKGQDVAHNTKKKDDGTPSPPRLQNKMPNIADPSPEKEPRKPAPAADPASRMVTAEAAAGGSPPSSRGASSSGTWQQYNSTYAARLAALGSAALAKGQALWGGQLPAAAFRQTMQNLAQGTTGGDSKELVVAGVLVKIMKGRPDIIAQVREGKFHPKGNDSADASGSKLCSSEDELWLEDSSGRVRLTMSVEQRACLVTGLVTCIRGMLTPEMAISVTGMCWPGTIAAGAPPAAMTAPSARPAGGAAGGGPYIGFISGLRIDSACSGDETGQPQLNSESARARLLDFLLGRSSDPSRLELSQAVARLVICGGTYPSSNLTNNQAESLQKVDAMLASIAAKMPVDLMPGRNEPTTLSLPQMPLLQHLFKEAGQCEHFKSRPNPVQLTLERPAVSGGGGARHTSPLQLVGHSGQPVEDYLRCAEEINAMEALVKTLEASHLAPTAPDTLPSRPFQDHDPFVMDKRPDIFFSGGHAKEEHMFIPGHDAVVTGAGGTLCVCVPAFHVQPALVLVSMQDTQLVRVLDFSAPDDVPM